MKSNKLIGMIQPKTSNDQSDIPSLHEVGCLGKITTFRETQDGRILIELKGIIRFKNLEEIKGNKKYRILKVDFKESVLSKYNSSNKIPFFHLGPKNNWKNTYNTNYQKKLNSIFNENLRELNYI